MNNNYFKLILKGFGLMSGSMLGISAHADFIKDSKADLELKNYYFNRDFRESAGQSKREEWAQGFILDVKSGFTEGTVGLGLDVVGMLGLKLDSSPDRSGSGLLSRDNDASSNQPSYSRRAHNEYSKFGVTGKLRFADTELRIGHLLPELPTLQPNASRLFPQTFRGTQVTSADIKGLALIGGQLDQTKQRESTDYEDMALTSQNGAYKSTARSDRFRFAGGDYKLTPNMSIGYHFAQLEDIYEQHFIGLKNSFPVGDALFKTDIRYFAADKSGAGLAGNVDNRALSTRAAFTYKGHSFGAGYQKQYGSTPFTYINGSNTFLFSEYQLSNFSQTGERVWHARYDFDFSALGIQGLTFSARWAKGDQAEIKGFAGEGREWERDVDLGYVFQSGTLKGLSLRLRNALSKANYFRDMNENRLIVGYTVALW
ncbi:OprD family porin [Pseudomonas piscis]|uniref:Outer membrane porin, OprD family n=1 Tax=Pseudomonas piscis TaxID=2614538 RepID=A0A7X1PN04_9PSED|nr:OprD family porin [Pseudomonas piscis]MQA54935.1 outer membrane porin, OprD family [Pseudomonas piscis]